MTRAGAQQREPRLGRDGGSHEPIERRCGWAIP